MDGGCGDPDGFHHRVLCQKRSGERGFATDKEEAAVSASAEEEAKTDSGDVRPDPDEEPLFDFYTKPSDWPKSVPIMNDFKVMVYEWSDDEMLAKGYGDVSIIRANNYYTNALKINVSSSQWEQNPNVPSITEGSQQTFNYIGNGESLHVFLEEVDADSLYFELVFEPANKK